MSDKTSLILIFGGRSGEHEVSVASATSIATALSKKKYDVTPVRIEKNGTWRVDRTILGGARGGIRIFSPDPGTRHLLTTSGKIAERIDVVFPIIHGTYGEDGCLQGLLELAGVPYVGSGVTGSAVGMDKIRQKWMLSYAGFPVTEFVAFSASEWRTAQASIIAEIKEDIGFPNFVKPSNLGSSVGISKAHHEKELIKAVREALAYDERVLVERAVNNAREIECAVLGDDDPQSSVLGEIEPCNEFYDYEAKYGDGDSELIIPSVVPKRLEKQLRAAAIGVFKTLHASGLGRVDFLLSRDTGEWYVNEINTLPGFTSISMYPKLWEATGLRYSALLDRLITIAQDRSKRTARLRRDFITS